MLLHLTCHQAVGALQHLTDFVQHAVLQLIVHAGDEGIAVDNGCTRDGVDGRVDVASEHGAQRHAVAHVHTHDLGRQQVEEGDVVAERVGESFQTGSRHTVVRVLRVHGVVIQAVQVCSNSVVVGSEAGIHAIGRQNLVVTNALQDIVETAKLVLTVGQIVFDGLACKRVQVRLVDVFLTTREECSRRQEQHNHCQCAIEKTIFFHILFLYRLIHIFHILAVVIDVLGAELNVVEVELRIGVVGQHRLEA